MQTVLVSPDSRTRRSASRSGVLSVPQSPLSAHRGEDGPYADSGEESAH